MANNLENYIGREYYYYNNNYYYICIVISLLLVVSSNSLQYIYIYIYSLIFNKFLFYIFYNNIGTVLVITLDGRQIVVCI